MKGTKDPFSDFKEKDLKQSREFGDDRRYRATRIDTVTFEMESDSPLRVTYVMYVPRLKKSIVSDVVLEDCGYDVIFSKGKPFLRHIDTGGRRLCFLEHESIEGEILRHR